MAQELQGDDMLGASARDMVDDGKSTPLAGRTQA